MSGFNRPPVWPYPVTVIGIMLAAVGFLIWLSTRPAATTASARDASARDMSRWQRIELECDRQVQTLMSTTDIVALERAKFLIGWFSCSVGRRLPPP